MGSEECDDDLMNTFAAATVVAAGLGLAFAPAAVADEAGFLDGIRALDHYALDCPGCAQDAVDVGREACQAFDLGGDQAAIAAVRKAYNSDASESAEYYATLFAQSASFELCPEHRDEIGQI
ncbi:hypothetical protein A5731_02010 [Mycolicibacterium conceptionense]|uniref:DUF732 domain-containing protein n=2 Tax=Mycolicibacterium TaxID=1866885 RepID=A0A1A1ZXC1_9MYCO|nr:hypothetical protein A5718_21970 [Mycolicibacterium conceptionense]OBE96114.1 hypothetical protein A5731_02010 [Mycolicibacterium conceptionense]OBF19649.1 hypothetical protein A5726_17520 [Mycolicibacterium conceptionense]OBF48114.1 hypothetical protein A5720_03525 [Mycolicibacterium conceptionense]OBI00264.1 hypothetical protein A5716_08525 [Mycolicibacterium conceptionense]